MTGKRGSDDADSTDGRGRRRGKEGGGDVPREETGWLDDLRSAKQAGDRVARDDFSTGGADRWAKLSALSDAEDDARESSTEGGVSTSGWRGGRREAPSRDSGGRDSGGGRRRAADEGGRRSAPEEPPAKFGRRDEPGSGRRSAPEEPPAKIGRRAAEEPQAKIGRRAGEVDGSRDTGRRSRSEPDTGRRSRSEDDDSMNTASGSGRRSRLDPDAGDPGRRGRSDAGDTGRRSRSEPEPSRRETPRRGRADLEEEIGRWRAPDFGAGESSSRNTPQGPAAGSARRRAPDIGRPLPPEEPPHRRATSLADLAGMSAPPISPARGPGAPGRRDQTDEPRRRPFGDRVAPAAAPGRSAGLKAPLTAAPEPTGPARPLHGAGALLGAPIPAGPMRPNAPASGGPAGSGDPRPRAGLAAGVQAIRGARSEVRRQLREQQRLRMWTLIALVVAVVGALPFYFVLQAATRDPVVTSLDALAVPAWAVTRKNDTITGSRWCVMDCRYRERTADSAKAIPETDKAYREALVGAGWTQLTGVPGCEEIEDPTAGESHSCWRRDEFTLDLTVTDPPCKQDALSRRPRIEITPSAAPSGSADPSTEPSPTPEACAGSVVHIKVFNAIDDPRLRFQPEPTLDPEFNNLTDEDVNPTPSATP